MLLVTILFAGCTDDGVDPRALIEPGTPEVAGAGADTSQAPRPTTAPTAAAGDDQIHLRGVILDDDGMPISGATVRAVTLDLVQETAADGSFDFGWVPQGFYPIQAEAAGYQGANDTFGPTTQSFRMQLVFVAPQEPYTTVVQFEGTLECALEAFIISPSCDSAVTFVGGPSVVQADNVFDYTTEIGWQTMVIDVVFDQADQPLLDGIRLSLRGGGDSNDLGSYEQYGRFYGSQSYTVHIAPGGEYEDGSGPIPADTTAYTIESFPHGHGYHPAGVGFLGVGVGVDVTYDLYVTTFYVEPAPEGYSILDEN